MDRSNKAQRPVKVFRSQGVTASIFENATDDGGRYFKVSFQRLYKQGNDWKSTPTFSRDDLPVVALLSQRSWQFVLDEEDKNRNEDDQE